MAGRAILLGTSCSICPLMDARCSRAWVQVDSLPDAGVLECPPDFHQRVAVVCVGGKEQDRLTGSLLVSTIAEQVERWTPAARNGHQPRRLGPSGWRWIRTY